LLPLFNSHPPDLTGYFVTSLTEIALLNS
jgi:hypothetical protein